MYSLNYFIKDILFENGKKELPVSGGSMNYGLADGKKVRIKPVKIPLKTGKNYIFIHENNLYLHRLIRVRGEKAQFLGDRKERFENVPVQAVIGELEWNESYILRMIIHLVNRAYASLGYKVCGGAIIRKKLIAILNKLGARDYEREV